MLERFILHSLLSFHLLPLPLIMYIPVLFWCFLLSQQLSAKFGVESRTKRGENSNGGNSNSVNVTCPACGEQVGASRFAQHLGKCIHGEPRKVAKRESSTPTPPPALPPQLAQIASVPPVPIAIDKCIETATTYTSVIDTESVTQITPSHNK